MHKKRLPKLPDIGNLPKLVYMGTWKSVTNSVTTNSVTTNSVIN